MEIYLNSTHKTALNKENVYACSMFAKGIVNPAANSCKACLQNVFTASGSNIKGVYTRVSHAGSRHLTPNLL